MSKFYEVLSELPPPLREVASEILDAILTSGDIVNWNRKLQLVVNDRTYPNTNIVDLIAHVLYPHDELVEEPKGFKLFIQALKDIKLESEWVENELVKDILDDANSSDSEDDDTEPNSSDKEVDDMNSSDKEDDDDNDENDSGDNNDGVDSSEIGDDDEEGGSENTEPIRWVG